MSLYRIWHHGFRSV